MKRFFTFLLMASLLFSSSLPSVHALEANSNDEEVIDQSQTVDEQSVEESSDENKSQVTPQLNPVAILLTSAGILWNANKYYEAVKESYIEEAVEKEFDLPKDCLGGFSVCESETIMDIDLDGETIYLSFGDADDYGFTHILGKHHPRYYYSNLFEKNMPHSFLDPGTSFNDIKKMVSAIAKENKRNIKKHGIDGKINVIGTYKNKKYVLVVNEREVVTLYPYDFNQATYK